MVVLEFLRGWRENLDDREKEREEEAKKWMQVPNNRESWNTHRFTRSGTPRPYFKCCLERLCLVIGKP